MKNYFFLLVFFLGLLACSTAPPPDDIKTIYQVETTIPQNQVVMAETLPQPAIVPEVLYIGNKQICQASLVGDFFGENMDVIGIVLLVITTLLGGLWFTARSKLKEISDLFLKAWEYTDDKKLDPTEREDLKKLFLKILTKTPT